MHKAYRFSLIYFALFTLLLLISGALLFDLKIGFESQRALSYYLGDPQNFIMAKSSYGLLKVVLAHIFAFALLSMVLLHFLAFTQFKHNKWSVFLVYLLFFVQFLEIFSPFLILWWSGFFIYLKIVSFFLYMLLVPFVFALLLYKL